jgi:hypothetical protein
MRKLSCSFLLIVLLFFCTSIAYCDSIYQPFFDHKNTLYVSLERKGHLSDYPGFAMSNERSGNIQIESLEKENSLYVGAGGPQNYWLAANARANSVVLMDSHPDVVFLHFVLWRTLFLVAESPSDFFDLLSGRLPKGGSKIIYKKYDKAEKKMLSQDFKNHVEDKS